MELSIFLASRCCLRCWRNFKHVLSSTFRVFQVIPLGFFLLNFSDIVGIPLFSADSPYSPLVCLTWTKTWTKIQVLHQIIDTSSACALYVLRDVIPHHRHNSYGWLHSWRSRSTCAWPPALSHSDTACIQVCMSMTTSSRCLVFAFTRCILISHWQQFVLQHIQTFCTDNIGSYLQIITVFTALPEKWSIWIGWF